jgi:hypothetical protein
MNAASRVTLFFLASLLLIPTKETTIKDKMMLQLYE